ncbi:MAG: bifunctional folylpolyglutamate synthase/dihydrofolate synthase [Candidatus Izemoplasmatales bacterium]|nr:bifunctional folylpolyglutamate synthase/dihydrofolate synthase [Candidatus Izemoplasmatales bacterium]
MFTTFEEAKNWIENAHRFGEKLDLDRMKLACERLGHPEASFKSIHVAGTNGKGSTANYLKNILCESGLKVGIYTSPYVIKFNERIGINDEFISDQEVVGYANLLNGLWDEIYNTYHDAITFFELLTLMAFLYFREHQIDFAVVEVGLGGLLDATNVIVPEISCITNISFDHMKQLGNTLESIALNKLGIVKEGVPLITSIEEKTLFPLFSEITAKRHARLKIVDFKQINQVAIGEITSFRYRDQPYEIQLPGMHQVKNACLAIEVIRELRVRNHLTINEKAIFDGLKRTRWPGRFEIFDHQVILDGAHNIGGIESLIQTLKTMYHGVVIKCLFCMMKDKEHKRVIIELDNAVDEFYFTEIDYPRRANAEDLFLESHHPKKFLVPDYRTIFPKLRAELKKNEILVVTGSLYFISDIRKLLITE